MQVGREDTEQHQPIAMLVSATWSLRGTFLRYTCKELSWILVLFWGKNLLFWKRPFCRWVTHWSKEALLWSTFCPSNLALVCPPCFWDAAVRLSSWLIPGQISLHEECHCHWEWQENSMWSQAASWILLSPASKAELWTQLSPADLSAFITTLKKKWKDH